MQAIALNQQLTDAIASQNAAEVTKILSNFPSSELANIKNGPNKGSSFIHLAVTSSEQILKLLLEVSDIDKDFVDKNDGTTALHIAVTKNLLSVAQLLLKYRVDPNVKNSKDGNTALHIAVDKHKDDMIALLLKPVYRVDVNAANNKRETPLMRAACHRIYPEHSLVLIQNGANVNAKDENRNTPLHYAIHGANAVVTETLLKAKADVNCINEKKQTPLSIAVANGHTSLVKTLLEYNVKVNVLGDSGKSPLHVAAEKGHLEIVTALLHAEADVNLECHEGATALHGAASYGHLNIFKVLVNTKADINAVDKDGNTPLHKSVFCRSEGKTQMLKYILESNADFTKQNTYGKTPFQAAEDPHRETSETLALLIEVGANVDCHGKPVTYDHLLKNRLFRERIFHPTFLRIERLKYHHHYLWFLLLQDTSTEMNEMVLRLVQEYPYLATVRDGKGRLAVDVATNENKLAINSMLLWFGKYRVNVGKPEHTSATCFVFKAVDESRHDENGLFPHVAVKLMRIKAQFEREIEGRKAHFESAYVIDTVAHYRPTNCHGDIPVIEVEEDSVMTKVQAENMYCVVMPLADRNMFVALKQERFAGQTELSEVKHIFKQLVSAVGHMHEKNVLHGDLTTLNIMRIGSAWKLIDLDASCRIGVDAVGSKSSSAYVPPEAVFVSHLNQFAAVRSEAICTKYHTPPLIAHSSFDVWSLGCILYQMCANAKPLFQASLDDNLSDNSADMHEDDSLWSLAEWSMELKLKKLAKISDALARNLLSLILTKDPKDRISIERILTHPFLTGKKFTRLLGEEAEYDVFISYRVNADLHHAEKVYELLTSRGMTVWWDKKCLLPGEDWEQGFCTGLMNSKAFVCLLSRDAISHPTITWQNFNNLERDSRCDNVLLEHRLALELREYGYISKIFPIMIGEVNGTVYSKFNAWPNPPHTHVISVEENLTRHMEGQGLGTPLHVNKTVASICTEISKCNGAFIEGEGEPSFQSALDGIEKMLSVNGGQTPQQRFTLLSPNNNTVSNAFASFSPMAQSSSKTTQANTPDNGSFASSRVNSVTKLREIVNPTSQQNIDMQIKLEKLNEENAILSKENSEFWDEIAKLKAENILLKAENERLLKGMKK